MHHQPIRQAIRLLLQSLVSYKVRSINCNFVCPFHATTTEFYKAQAASPSNILAITDQNALTFRLTQHRYIFTQSTLCLNDTVDLTSPSDKNSSYQLRASNHTNKQREDRPYKPVDKPVPQPSYPFLSSYLAIFTRYTTGRLHPWQTLGFYAQPTTSVAAFLPI